MQSNVVNFRPLQNMNFVWTNNLSLKYQVCTPSECKDIVIRKFEYDAKTQFLFVVKNAVLLRVCNDTLSKFVLIGNGNDFFSQAKIF